MVYPTNLFLLNFFKSILLNKLNCHQTKSLLKLRDPAGSDFLSFFNAMPDNNGKQSLI